MVSEADIALLETFEGVFEGAGDVHDEGDDDSGQAALVNNLQILPGNYENLF